jgi:holo-[acyl-carrier protein] synthase
MERKYGNKFLNRVFTSSEKKYCSQRDNSAQHYAVRFAAKEATAKALGLGFGKALDWKDIVVCNNEEGAPFIKFRNEVAKKIKKNGYKCHLSMAHCTDYATAISILELA